MIGSDAPFLSVIGQKIKLTFNVGHEVICLNQHPFPLPAKGITGSVPASASSFAMLQNPIPSKRRHSGDPWYTMGTQCQDCQHRVLWEWNKEHKTWAPKSEKGDRIFNKVM